MQIYGGHGYIREHGMEQFVRDARITQIYEGTNGIQALDLVGRKMSAHYGRYLRALLPSGAAIHRGERGRRPDGGDCHGISQSVRPAAAGGGRVAQKGLGNPNEAAAAASDLLKLLSYVSVGFMWARMAKLAYGKQGDDPTGFYKGKIKTARFYMSKLMPQTGALLSSILAGGETIMDLEDELFDSAVAA